MNVVFPKSLQLRWLVKEMAVWIADCFGSYLWQQYFCFCDSFFDLVLRAQLNLALFYSNVLL